MAEILRHSRIRVLHLAGANGPVGVEGRFGNVSIHLIGSDDQIGPRVVGWPWQR
jgi:hypothetical protein